ncbi:MAG: trypsin-like serine protease [Methylococcales bacterium]
MQHFQIALLILLIPVLASANTYLSPDSQQFQQRIVKGTLTSKQPAVGNLLLFDTTNQQWYGICSASLIDHSTVLTAAHCVCETFGDDCQMGFINAPQPEQFMLYFQHAGFFQIKSISLPQQYEFPKSDYAVINLTETVPAISPLQLATSQPTKDSAAQLVGFGTTAQQARSSSGLLRSGSALLSDCNTIDLESSDFLCWNHSPDAPFANSCNGDSGGTLLSGTGDTLFGIISGGVHDCDKIDTGFSTAIATIHKDVLARSKHLTVSQAITLKLNTVYSASDNLDAFAQKTYRMTVSPPSAENILISSNATDSIGSQTILTVNSDTATCQSAKQGSFQSCQLKKQDNQTIEINLQNNSNHSILFQINASVLENRCHLDIDDNGTIDALTDGLLILRALLGIEGNALINNTVSNNGKRITSEEILNYIQSDACTAAMDIDQNGTVDALSDGIMIIRYLFGVRGTALIEGITKQSESELPIFLERLALLSEQQKITYLELEP